MAKLAVKLRNEKRRKTVEKFKAKRAALLEIIQSSRASDEAREQARAKLQQLRADRTPARRLSQVRSGPQQAARAGAARRGARHHQGELVRETVMSMHDPIADMLTRIRNAQ